MAYDPSCPRCKAAHDAGEKTAIKLLTSEFKFSPSYVAMAVVQDALTAYCKAETKAEVRPSRRPDWHYDSQGYCDNPGRGY